MARRVVTLAACGAIAIVVVIAAELVLPVKLEATDMGNVATPQKPAVVEIRRADSITQAPAAVGSVVVDVVGFQPPPKGTVQAVVSVKADTTGATKEIGRFGLFPNSHFKAGSDADTQRFRLDLDQTASKLVQQEGKVSIGLVPFGGSGEGARLDIGKVDLLAK